MNRVSVVYVVENVDAGIFKVGMSGNIDQRVKGLVAHSGCTMNVIYTSKPMNWGVCRKMEEAIHKEFSKWNVTGEWFRCDVNSIVNYIQDIDKRFKAAVFYLLLIDGRSFEYVSKFTGVSISRIKKVMLSTRSMDRYLELNIKTSDEMPVMLEEVSEEEKYGEFIRVDGNLFTNGYCWKVKVFKDGEGIVHGYFREREEAEKFISQQFVKRNLK